MRTNQGDHQGGGAEKLPYRDFGGNEMPMRWQGLPLVTKKDPIPNNKVVALEVENYVPYLRHRRADAGAAAAATNRPANAIFRPPESHPAPCALKGSLHQRCLSPLRCAGGGNAPACPGEVVDLASAEHSESPALVSDDPTREAADIDMSFTR